MTLRLTRIAAPLVLAGAIPIAVPPVLAYVQAPLPLYGLPCLLLGAAIAALVGSRSDLDLRSVIVAFVAIVLGAFVGQAVLPHFFITDSGVPRQLFWDASMVDFDVLQVWDTASPLLATFAAFAFVGNRNLRRPVEQALQPDGQKR